jgi:hypothetical protein
MYGTVLHVMENANTVMPVSVIRALGSNEKIVRNEWSAPYGHVGPQGGRKSL